jgi:rare lipoprotein A
MGPAIFAGSGSAGAQSFTDATFWASGPEAASGPLGAWTTTVTPETGVRPRDPSWTATLFVAAPSRITTASIARTDRPQHSDVPRGPRITGAGHELTGMATFYGQGELTATGERFDPTALTAAHRTLPFGTRVRVTRLDTGNSVVVRINDRGPFKPGRVIDLSERAAENLGMTGIGVTPVRLEVIGP